MYHIVFQVCWFFTQSSSSRLTGLRKSHLLPDTLGQMTGATPHDWVATSRIVVSSDVVSQQFYVYVKGTDLRKIIILSGSVHSLRRTSIIAQLIVQGTILALSPIILFYNFTFTLALLKTLPFKTIWHTFNLEIVFFCSSPTLNTNTVSLLNNVA